MSQAGHRAYPGLCTQNHYIKTDTNRYPTASSLKYVQMRPTKHLVTDSYIEYVCRLTTTRQMLYTFAIINKGDDLGVDATA